MTGTKVAISIVLAAAVLLPVSFFTDVLADVLGAALSSLGEGYRASLEANPKPLVVLSVTLVFGGPILIFFLLFWYLWLQRNKQQVMLAIYAKAMDVHGWLERWTQVPQDGLPSQLKSLAPKALKSYRKIDRLLAMQHKRNWRCWYSLYLVLFYFFNAPKLSAFREVRVEPPPEEWPDPHLLTGSASGNQVDIARNAVAFSESFADGAKAWTGHEFLMHTLIGTVFGGLMAGILGGVLVLFIIRNTGPWTSQLLVGLTFSVAVGLVAAYFWQRIASMSGTNREKNTVAAS
jgi:MFS family permease